MTETPPLYSARPTVRLADADNPDLTDGLISALVEETGEGLARCEATFGNWGTSDGSVGFLYDDRRILDFGKRFGLRAGAGDKAGDLFDGRITALEGDFPADRAPEVTVLAEDRLQDLRMTRRTRSFEGADASEVVQLVAADHGLQTATDVDGPTFAVLAQVNQSDLAFLREVAAAVDAELWLEAETLHLAPRSRRTGGPVTLTYGRELREFAVVADLAAQRTSFTVGGWDVAAKEAIHEEADASAIGAESAGTTTGASILRTAFGERKERIVHAVPFTAAEGTAMAEAAMRRTSRRFARGRAVSEGDARIGVGAAVDIEGVGAMFNGTYRVAKVRHHFDSSRGFLTTSWLERAGIGEG